MDESWRPILRLFRIGPTSENTVTSLLIFLGLVILLVFLVEIGITLIRRRRRLQEEWEWFYRYSEAKDLSEREVELITLILRHGGGKHPARILKSLPIFDTAVQTYFQTADLNDIEQENIALELRDIRRKLHFDHLPPYSGVFSTRTLKPGYSLRLIVESSEQKRYFRTHIIAIDDQKIDVAYPLEGEQSELLLPGHPIGVYFWNWGDAGYYFDSEIINIIRGDQLLLRLTHAEHLTRDQRRNFFRIKLSQPFEYTPLNEDEATAYKSGEGISLPEDFNPKTGTMTGISGGGISFVTGDYVDKGTILLVQIGFKHYPLLTNIYGQIIRRREIKSGMYKYFLEFIHIAEKDQETIIHYIAQLQRERLLR